MPSLRGVAAGAVIGGAAYSAWLICDWGGESVVRVADDLGLVGFALFAAICTVVAAFRLGGRERMAWISLGIGSLAWALGELCWSYDHLVRDLTARESCADVGYVAFLIGAVLCLILLLSAHPVGTQLRLFLDAVIVCAAVSGAAWVSFLGAAYATGTSGGFTLAYPVGDIALLTVSALMLARAPKWRRLALALLTVGLLCITVSDAAYAYLTAVHGFSGRHYLAIGWAWGFGCLGLAGLAHRQSPDGDRRIGAQPPTGASAWLPYVPVALSAAICTPGLLGELGAVAIAAMVTVYATMARQLLVILENRRLLAELADQALHDPLTGLANRTLFQERLEDAVVLQNGRLSGVAVLLIDLDHFKLVNDSLGHAAGDAMLVEVAHRLTATARSSDTVARLGGDEFAVLMAADVDVTRATAHGVVAAFDAPIVVGGADLLVRPSAGLAVADAADDALSSEDLLNRADVAMYAAKRSRADRLFVYSADLEPVWAATAGQPALGAGECADLTSSSARLLGELRDAIEHLELSVVYQPKFDLRTYEIVGLEALIRWPHPRRGLLGPDQFLPLVRQYGLMRAMTEVVLELALDDAARWYDMGLGVPVAINVFAPAIGDPELCEQITRALDVRGLPAECLTVEITEDLLLDNMGNTRSVFNRLRDKGIRVAIDDFGSGYSALWYLREFPVDEVKLDKDFIAPILSHPASAAIVQAVIDLAHALGITPVAEGVENVETARRLRQYGCEVAQGFHYSPPLPAAAVQELLESQERGSVVLGAATDSPAPGAARSS